MGGLPGVRGRPCPTSYVRPAASPHIARQDPQALITARAATPSSVTPSRRRTQPVAGSSSTWASGRASRGPSRNLADLHPAPLHPPQVPQTEPAREPASREAHGTAHQVTNFLAMVLPFAGFLAATVLLWGSLFTWIDLAALAVAYIATCVGVTVGFHRLLTHRSFQTYPAVRYTLAVLGTLAIEGSVVKWVADHRKHHNFTDKEGDPHSPHASGSGALGALKGLWHAHVGWLFNNVGQAEQRRYAPDLLKDRGLMWIDAAEKPLMAASLVLPFLLGL